MIIITLTICSQDWLECWDGTASFDLPFTYPNQYECALIYLF